MVGAVGACDGDAEGIMVGCADGASVGCPVGTRVGIGVGGGHVLHFARHTPCVIELAQVIQGSSHSGGSRTP